MTLETVIAARSGTGLCSAWENYGQESSGIREEEAEFRVADPWRIRNVDLDESAKFIRHGEPDERSAADANKALYGQRQSPNSPFAHRPTSR